MQTFGERLRELREEHDLSLRELARRLGGLSAAFLSDVELGRRYPSEDVLAKMAQVLGSSVEALKAFDTRPPVEALKKLVSENPAYGLALRKVIDKQVSAEELMKLAEQKPDRGKKK